MHGRPWTSEEEETLERLYGAESARAIGERIGRTEVQVHRRAVALGVAGRCRTWSAEDDATIAALNADGASDTEVAARLGRDRHSTTRRRKALGLSSNARGAGCRAKLASAARDQVARLGLASLNELRTSVWRRRAVEAGWPPTINGRSTTARHVQILDLLYERGPSTRLEIATAIGAPTDSKYGNVLSSGGPGGSFLAELVRAGFVVNLGRIVGGRGKGGNVCLYALELDVERSVS